jgi:spermidine synthase
MSSEGEEKYIDRSWPEWGVSYHWSGGKVVEKKETVKGTVLEMVHRPRWGLACYMNGELQSCETDERLYHETLVHPAMIHTVQPRRVLLIGGGEGATAREALKWPSVERIDMYEWDAEVVDCFRERYRQWADGAWEDPRLVIHIEDIFSVIQPGIYPHAPYDVILIDLFEPESDPRMWGLFSRLASDWLSEGGAMAMYAGVRNHWSDVHPAEKWLDASRIQEYHQQHISINQVLSQRDVFSYKVFLPSFLGEATFLLLVRANQIPQWSTLTSSVPRLNGAISSHLTSDVWMAYHTWNRYHLAGERLELDTEGVFHGV